MDSMGRGRRTGWTGGAGGAVAVEGGCSSGIGAEVGAVVTAISDGLS